MQDLGITILNAITAAMNEGKEYTEYIIADIDPKAVYGFNDSGKHQIEYKEGSNNEFRIKISKG